MKKTYNYTKIRRRESRVYGLEDVKLPVQGGVTTTYLKTAGLLLVVFLVTSYIFNIFSKNNLFSLVNIFTKVSVMRWWIIGAAFILGGSAFLTTQKIQGYTISQYLRMALMPKPVINIRNKKVKLNGYKTNTFIENYRRY